MVILDVAVGHSEHAENLGACRGVWVAVSQYILIYSYEHTLSKMYVILGIHDYIE